MYRFAAIFDFDGVIAQTAEFHERAWTTFRHKYRNNISDGELRENVFGRTNLEALRYLFKHKLEKGEIVKFGAEKEELFRDEISRGEVRAVNGLEAFLNELEGNRIPTAIATSACKENVECVLQRLLLGKYFNKIIYAEDPGTPNPERYKKAADKLGFRGNYGSCVVFEDSVLGSQIAKEFGMKVCAITHKPEQFAHADLKANDFTEVKIERIDKMMLD